MKIALVIYVIRHLLTFMIFEPTQSLLSYLKNNGLVVLLEVEGKDVSEHECGAALAQHIHGLLQELHLNP